MKAKKGINFIIAIITFLFLGILAYIGLTGLIPSLPVPDFIKAFAVQYDVFETLNWTNFAIALPLIFATIFSITAFSEKNFKLVFLFLEIAFIVIIFLYGFNVLPH